MTDSHNTVLDRMEEPVSPASIASQEPALLMSAPLSIGRNSTGAKNQSPVEQGGRPLAQCLLATNMRKTWPLTSLPVQARMG